MGKPNYFLYFVGKGVDNNKLNVKLIDAEPEHRTGSRRSEYNKDKLPEVVML